MILPNSYVWHRTLGFCRYLGPDTDSDLHRFAPVRFTSKHTITYLAEFDCEPFVGQLPSYLKDTQ